MQSRPDGEFKWILDYQDHFTKRVSLRALRNKTGLEVANALIEIFAENGAPEILQSDAESAKKSTITYLCDAESVYSPFMMTENLYILHLCGGECIYTVIY